MKNIYISAGHSSGNSKTNNLNSLGKPIDRGAAGNGFIEGVEMAEFREIIVKELKSLGANVIVDKDDSILADTLKDFKPKTKEGDIVLDLHMNSATPKATGVETLVPDPPTNTERILAEKISKKTSEILGIPMRGVKGVKTEAESQHKRLGFMRLSGTNILLEVCFISNPNDMKSYRDKRFGLGKALAKILYDESLGATTQNERIYTVVSGDSLSKIAIKFNTTITKLKSNNALSSDLIKVGQKLKI